MSFAGIKRRFEDPNENALKRSRRSSSSSTSSVIFISEELPNTSLLNRFDQLAKRLSGFFRSLYTTYLKRGQHHQRHAHPPMMSLPQTPPISNSRQKSLNNIAVDSSSLRDSPHPYEGGSHTLSEPRPYIGVTHSIPKPHPHITIDLTHESSSMELKSEMAKPRSFAKKKSGSRVLHRLYTEKEDEQFHELIESYSQMGTNTRQPDSVGSLTSNSPAPITQATPYTNNIVKPSCDTKASAFTLYSTNLPSRKATLSNPPSLFSSSYESPLPRPFQSHSDALSNSSIHPLSSNRHRISISSSPEELSFNSSKATPISSLSPSNIRDAFKNDWLDNFKMQASKFADHKARIEMFEKYNRIYRKERMEAEDRRNERQFERLNNLMIRAWTPNLDIEEEIAEELVLDLPAELETHVDTVWSGGRLDQLFSERKNIRVTRQDLLTLRGLEWLNDAVINFYMTLVVDTVNDSGDRKVHLFNSFFYPKIMSAGYSGVKRWTKKVDIFSFDIVLLPVHLGMHWCLASIDFRRKCILYFDSLKGSNTKCLHILKDYLVSEAKDKKQIEYDVSDWKMDCCKDIPDQHNGSDCGVFACMYARHIARDKPMNFTQADLPAVRRMMVAEIVSDELLLL